MKYLLFILIALFGTFASESFATENQMACTKEYAPVCGSIQVQCFAAPCNPVRETFSNACVAKSRNATDVVKGECKDTTTVPPVIGGDTDIHGCKASAGYKWSALAGKCLRPWESRISTVTIAPVNDTCTDRDPKNCLQGKFGFQKDWFNFYGGISGFDYEYGYTYHLRILQTYSSHQSIDYSLIKVLSKKTISEPANSEIL